MSFCTCRSWRLKSGGWVRVWEIRIWWLSPNCCLQRLCCCTLPPPRHSRACFPSSLSLTGLSVHCFLFCQTHTWKKFLRVRRKQCNMISFLSLVCVFPCTLLIKMFPYNSDKLRCLLSLWSSKNWNWKLIFISWVLRLNTYQQATCDWWLSKVELAPAFTELVI